MTSAFVSIGAGLLTLAPVILRAARADRVGEREAGRGPGLLVAVAVAIGGVGMVVAGVFRTDPGRSGPTADAIHSRASALATVALIIAALVWSFGRARPSRRPIVGSLARDRGCDPRRAQSRPPPFGMDGREPARPVADAVGVAAVDRIHVGAGVAGATGT